MAYNKNKILFVLIGILFILGIIIYYFAASLIPAASRNNNFSQNISSDVLKKGSLVLGGQTIKIELASTNQAQYKGLSNRDNLCADCGMFFDFPYKDKLNFVMRDMHFPLDIIFINDETILNIAANLAPEGSKTNNIYSSISEANRVLEVNAGYCQKYGIKAGDKISDIKIN